MTAPSVYDDWSVHELELSVRASNCLAYADITTIGVLRGLTPQELLRLPNFGRQSLGDVYDCLGAWGLSLTRTYQCPACNQIMGRVK